MATLEYQRPFLYPKQLNAFFHDKRYGLIEATTKAGKTVGGMAWLLEKAIISTIPGDQGGKNYWWVAPVYPQAEIAYTRMKTGLTRGSFHANDTKMRISLPCGSLIWFKSGEKPDNLYGDNVWAALMDEASRGREEAFHAVRSTLTKTRGQFRGIGNVRGRQNWFYRMCRKAESGAPDMHYAKIIAADAVDAGILSADEIDDAKRNLPEQVFRELYLAEPSDDGGNPFGLQHIAQCIGELSNKPPRVWGIDLAKSVDFTVAIALDADGRVCRFERWQAPWNITKARITELVAGIDALVDSTGVGDPILEDLQRISDNFEGFKFSQSSKQQLMEGLSVAIQQHAISFPAGLIATELECFEYEITRTGVRYNAPEGLHDDCVCALALAVWKHRKPGVGDGALAYYQRLKDERLNPQRR